MRNRTPKLSSDGLSLPVRSAFLGALRDTCSVTVALQAVRRARSGACALRQRNSIFRDEWDQALLDARSLLDDALCPAPFPASGRW